MHDQIPQIVELMRKMRQTASRSLRKHYADEAKVLLREAEKSSSKSSPAAQAALRKARNELVQVLDLEFPISQRQEDLKGISPRSGLGELACSFGIIEGDQIHKGPSWLVVGALALLAFSVGRTTKKIYRRMRRS